MLLSASIAGVVNCAPFYRYGFARYGVSQTTGISPEELSRVASELVRYWNSGDEYINLTVTRDGQSFPLFNEREIVHLKDVKALFRLDYLVLAGTLVGALGYTVFCFTRGGPRREWAAGLAWGGGLTLGLIGLLGAAALIDFDSFYWLFHRISFTNDLWQLDPSRDYLLRLITGGFQNEAVLLIFGATAAGALLLALAGYGLRRRFIPV